MNVLVVNNHQINNLPPVRNLIEVLIRGNHNVTVITRDEIGAYIKNSEKLKYIVIPEYNNRGIYKIISYLKRKFWVRQQVLKEMENNDILWTTTDATVRDLGNIVLKYKHVMQMMELIEDIPAFPKQNIIKANLKKYAQKAYKVVVPEYNRAHIQKTWWDLKELPEVLPNKMAENIIDAIPQEIQDIIDGMKREKRKIILYQGLFQTDRDLDIFAKTIEKSEEYCFYIMGKDSEYRKQLCEQYSNIKYIQYIKPPFHLAITKNAYIGLLPYKSGKVKHFSVLNALYCAPNKIFEYAAYGVPMIGTDVPGLHTIFMSYDIGKICKEQTEEEINNILREIENRYDVLQKNCREFYDSVDLDKIVSGILEE